MMLGDKESGVTSYPLTRRRRGDVGRFSEARLQRIKISSFTEIYHYIHRAVEPEISPA
jgi:hypothetical protein